MLYEHANPEAAGLGHQHEFARSLADSLGLDAALQVCRDNGWDGIWDILRDEPTILWS